MRFYYRPLGFKHRFCALGTGMNRLYFWLHEAANPRLGRRLCLGHSRSQVARGVQRMKPFKSSVGHLALGPEVWCTRSEWVKEQIPEYKSAEAQGMVKAVVE